MAEAAPRCLSRSLVMKKKHDANKYFLVSKCYDRECPPAVSSSASRVKARRGSSV